MPQHSFLENWSCETNQNTVIFPKQTLNGIRASGLDLGTKGYFVGSFTKISFSAFFSNEGLFTFKENTYSSHG